MSVVRGDPTGEAQGSVHGKSATSRRGLGSRDSRLGATGMAGWARNVWGRCGKLRRSAQRTIVRAPAAASILRARYEDAVHKDRVFSWPSTERSFRRPEPGGGRRRNPGRIVLEPDRRDWPRSGGGMTAGSAVRSRSSGFFPLHSRNLIPLIPRYPVTPEELDGAEVIVGQLGTGRSRNRSTGLAEPVEIEITASTIGTGNFSYRRSGARGSERPRHPATGPARLGGGGESKKRGDREGGWDHGDNVQPGGRTGFDPRVGQPSRWRPPELDLTESEPLTRRLSPSKSSIRDTIRDER